jgi:hypothetical protein
MASEDLQRKADKVASVAASVDGPVHEGSQLLQGKVPSDDSKSMGHPIHPATVHWPIAVSPCSSPSSYSLPQLCLLPRTPYPPYSLSNFMTLQPSALGSSCHANPSSYPPHSLLQPSPPSLPPTTPPPSYPLNPQCQP